MEDELNEQLQQEVDIVHQARPLRLGVDLDGVSIKDDSGAITVIPKSFIRLQLPINRPLIRSIVLSDPNIHVLLSENEQKKEIKLPENFPFDNLQINNASIQLEAKDFTYQGSGLSLVYHKGVDFWTEDKTRLKSSDRKLSILPFRWENIEWSQI